MGSPSSPPTPPSGAAASSASNGATPLGSTGYTASEWTQQNMLTDLLQRKGLLIGAAVVVIALLVFRKRSAPPAPEKAARRLVRDWRRVDAPTDVRDLLGENLPAILRPVLLLVLAELERLANTGFRRLEHEIDHL